MNILQYELDAEETSPLKQPVSAAFPHELVREEPQDSSVKQTVRKRSSLIGTVAMTVKH